MEESLDRVAQAKPGSKYPPAKPGALDDEPLKAAEGPLSRSKNAEAISRSTI